MNVNLRASGWKRIFSIVLMLLFITLYFGQTVRSTPATPDPWVAQPVYVNGKEYDPRNPPSIKLGETVDIVVMGWNYIGDDASEAYLEISFPYLRSPSSYVEIIPGITDLPNTKKYPPGSTLWGGYGTIQITSQYWHVEGYDAPWKSGKKYWLGVRVKPEQAGEFLFEVKMVAKGYDGKWYADPQTDGTPKSPRYWYGVGKDQQSEWVYLYIINVVSEPPSPQITSITISATQINLGESFWIEASGVNNGGVADGWSSLTFSFPAFNRPDDKARVSIISHSFTEADEYTVVKAKGETIYHKTQGAIPAEYLLVEGGVKEGGAWSKGESNYMRLSVTPREAGDFHIYIRLTLATKTGAKVTDPASSSYTDQQGYLVYRRTVKVIPPTGNLQVNVHNIPDLPNLPKNGVVEVRLWSGNYGKYIGNKSVDINGETYKSVIFYDLTPGDYTIEVYQTPKGGHREFWGANLIKAEAGKTNVFDFYRHTQAIWGVRFEGLTDQQLSLGQSVMPKINVKNYEPYDKEAKVKLVIDRDMSPPYDYERTSDTYIIPRNGGTSEFIFPDFKPIDPGTYYYYIILVGKYGPDGKFIVTDQVIWTKAFEVKYAPPPQPDLTITSVRVSPYQVYVGGKLTVSWTEENRDKGDAGDYFVGVYLGKTEYGRDYKLGEVYSSGLKAGAAIPRSYEFSIPPVPPGDYYVTVFIDETRRVKESNEDNNIGSTTPNKITVKARTTLTLDPPASAVEGQSIIFTGRLVLEGTNIGISGAIIEIYDSDVDRDDLIAEGITGPDGRFEILWTAKQMDPWDTTIEVYAKYGGSAYYEPSRSPEKSFYTINLVKIKIIEFNPPSGVIKFVNGLTVHTELTLKSLGYEGQLWAHAVFVGPGGKIYHAYSDSISMKSNEQKIIDIPWKLPYDVLPGTYSVIVHVTDKDPRLPDSRSLVASAKPFSFMIDRGVSYIQIEGVPSLKLWGVLDVGEERIFHIHIDKSDLESTGTTTFYGIYLLLSSSKDVLSGICGNFYTPLMNLIFKYRGMQVNFDIYGHFDLLIVQLAPTQFGYVYTTKMVGLDTKALLEIPIESTKVIMAFLLGGIGLPPIDRLTIIPNSMLEVEYPSLIYISRVATMDVQPVTWSDLVEAGKSKTQTFTVSASGGTVRGVTVTKLSGPDWLTITPISLGDIPAGSSETFTVTASPPTGISGSFNYSVRVTCTEGEPKSIDISGTITVTSPSRVDVRASNVRLSVEEDGFSKIILSEAPSGLAGYEIIVRLVPQAGVQQDIADIVDVRFPEWAGLTYKSIEDDQARLRAVDVRNIVRAGSEEIILAEVVLRGKAEGTMQIEINVIRMDDDEGESIFVSIKQGVLEVVPVLGPPPVEENLPPPRDLDGDGLYEDINGNGRLDFDDVVKFFRHFDDPVISQYSRYYDFNRNGRLDYDDIVELFKRV